MVFKQDEKMFMYGDKYLQCVFKTFLGNTPQWCIYLRSVNFMPEQNKWNKQMNKQNKMPLRFKDSTRLSTFKKSYKCFLFNR